MILQGDDRVSRVLVPDDELVVDGRGHPLLWVALADAGVKEARPTVGSGDSAAGEDVFLTFVQRGPEGDREVFPVHQVAAAGVAPVHVAPGGAVGIELAGRERLPWRRRRQRRRRGRIVGGLNRAVSWRLHSG